MRGLGNYDMPVLDRSPDFYGNNGQPFYNMGPPPPYEFCQQHPEVLAFVQCAPRVVEERKTGMIYSRSAAGSYTSHETTETLAQAIQKGETPFRPDGTPFSVREFLGGYLLDGLPINVWVLGTWIEGQKEALQPEWTAGRIPRPADTVLNLPVESALGISTTMLLIGGAALFLFLRKRRP